MAKLPPFGKSKRERLRGGETWTVINVQSGKEQALRIKLNDRMRLESRFNWSDNVNLYPEATTEWYALGNENIKLTQLRDHPQKGKLYQFEVLIDAAKKQLWLEEGGAGNVELTLHETNPDEGRVGAGSGAAGYRR